jgi:hypothetical protein
MDFQMAKRSQGAQIIIALRLGPEQLYVRVTS